MGTPILLVDDKRANLTVLEAVLGTSSYELVSVTSGPAALDVLAEREFAVALVDLQMPGMDGVETAARMKAHAQTSGHRTPIIVVTATDTDRELLLRTYESGAVDVIHKPFEPRVLSAKVAIFAELFRARVSIKEATEKRDQEQRKAEEEARRFRLLVESVKDYAIFILDPKGFVSTWNPGAQRIKGYEASDIIGKHFSIFYPPEDAASGKCEGELEIASAEGRFEEEGWRVRKDGSRLWASVTITALRDDRGALVGFAKVTRDLTERVRHEEMLRRLAAERATLTEKARIQEFQERFIAVLGHDLRNPLAAVNIGASLLRQLLTKETHAAGINVLNRISASAGRMSRMIEQILDLTRSRLTGGLVMAPAPMDLSSAIHSVVEELKTLHPARAIEVSGPPSVPGVWDRDRLEQVFSNLVGNAVNYGSPSSPVEVEVQEGVDSVIVSVHNDGPPIPESTRAELFNPFRRGERDSRTSETAGLGLGLYISREIALAHRGTIDVTSTAAEGTTFRLNLPRSGAVTS